MKPEPQFLRPRSAVVFEHTRRMLAGTNLCLRKWGHDVVKQYVDHVAPNDRHVPFKLGLTDVELLRAEKHNAQQLGRYMDGTIKVLPTDLEDAWVLALPEPYRGACERELASRRGFYAEKQHSACTAGDIASMADLSREFGELLNAIAPALADGCINDADLVHADRILAESTDLIAAALTIQRRIAELLAQRKAHA